MARPTDATGTFLKDVCNALEPVKLKWLEIGVQLKVPPHKLEEFKKEDNSLVAVITYCLRGNVQGDALCWQSIVQALESPQVGEPGRAKAIRLEYCQQKHKEVQHNIQQESGDEAMYSKQKNDASSLDPDIHENLIFILQRNLRQILYRYSSFVAKLNESIRVRVDVDTLQNYLLNLPALTTPGNEHCKVLTDLSEDLYSIQTVDKIFGFISINCADFLHYDIFAGISKVYGSSTDHEQLEQYTKCLEEYINKHKIEEFIKINPKLKDIKGTEKVCFKLDTKLLPQKLAQVAVVKQAVAEILDIVPAALRFYNVEEGCVVLTFLVPVSVAKKVFSRETSLTERQISNFQDLSVKWVKCGDFSFNFEDILNKATSVITTDTTPATTTNTAIITTSAIIPSSGRGLQLPEDGVQPYFKEKIETIKLKMHLYNEKHHESNYTSFEGQEKLSSGDSAYVSASATHSSDSITTESDAINPAEELLKTAEPTSVDSRADLHDIINVQDINIIKEAIEKELYNPLSKDVYGYTALHVAAKYGKFEIMKYLIEEEGINPSIPGPQGTTPLNVAAEAGNFSIVKFLIEDQHVDPSTNKDEDGYLPLHYACVNNNLSMVKYLFEKVKNVSYMESNDFLCEFTKHDTAPLHIAALHGHLEFVKFFIEECECDPNLSNKAGRTALFFACEIGSLEIVKYFVEVHLCQPSATDKSNNTPLHLAAQNESLPIVQYLIEEKSCDSKCKNNQGNTPLLEASFSGMLIIVKYLIKIGCDPRKKENNVGYNCLHAACSHGHTEVIQYLIKEQHVNPNTPTRNTKTNSLHIAATQGYEPTVRYLIEEMKLDPDCKDEDDYTPFHLAAMYNHLDVIQYLMGKKCSPFVINSRNETPLSLAKDKGNHKVVEFIEVEWENLLKNTSNSVTMFYAVNIKHGKLEIIRKQKNEILRYISLNEFEIPLIHYAVIHGNLEIMKYFIEEGIYKANCKDSHGLTPLHIAASCGQLKIFQHLVKECKCDPMCRTRTQPTILYGGDTYLGMTPLHSAVKNGQLPMVQHILESDYGVDPEVQTYDGKTPLFAAAHAGHLDITKYLIDKHKCKINHRDEILMTPLHGAAQEGYLQVVKYLIQEQYCDPFAEDNYRQTPFHVAAIRGRLEIIDYYIKDLKVSPNFGDADNITALHLAAGNGYMHVVKYLTKLPECNSSCTSNLGTTPLHWAAENGELEIVKYLIKTAKCNHMDKNIFEETPLHLAAECGRFEVTKFLVEEMHTPPALKNNNNQTPLHLALYNGHGKVALYLIVVLYNIVCKVIT